jgi:cysteinyl-tRNA synthetase
MTTIRLHNTATRAKETFTPIDPANVRMYVCGPTVYDRAHLGNARPVVVFDTLFRLLRHVYGADHVTYVRNFTDVDDKINAEALRRRDAGASGTLEELIHQRTEETIGWYHADMDALGALRPTSEPQRHDLRILINSGAMFIATLRAATSSCLPRQSVAATRHPFPWLFPASPCQPNPEVPASPSLSCVRSARRHQTTRCVPGV